MSRPERPLDPRQGPVESFAYDLRQLRRRSGNLTYRQLAKVAGFSNTTLSTAARGERLPSLDVCLAYVRSCGGDVDQWEERWRRVARELDEQEIRERNGSGRERPSMVNSRGGEGPGAVDTLPERRRQLMEEAEQVLPLGSRVWSSPAESMRGRVEHLERRLWQVLVIATVCLLLLLVTTVSVVLVLASRM
ncbi:helix-turn-helix transcriptional regulator [Nocardiopsis exhalans]|uniref:Helix-turn-helix transcriptional regulator n=1 Tax=Nocardiopsis exhalans TaxID=163604 RepID=A0ABY5D539_9ACTN|nr:helix-turn-helix transcriptional regulator [Nocardiopsis exhalans]USY19080.1 helix-turn-helix transcriptional regulator [Nocardiopsis exhalans]